MTVSVVLVPGAWHGAWCWERVLPLLRSSGVIAVALDLPGRDGPPSAAGDLHADAEAVRAELARHERVVLVGHSYGGAVVTEAGDHPAVEHLVYLAAFPLEEDESCAAAGGPEAAAIDHSGRPDPGLTSVEGGYLALSERGATECFYDDCDMATVRWALDRLGLQPAAALSQSPSAVAWRSRTSTYVVCSRDQGVHPELQRLLSRRCTSVTEWPTGHSPFLSRPDLVAGLLTDLVTDHASS